MLAGCGQRTLEPGDDPGAGPGNGSTPIAMERVGQLPSCSEFAMATAPPEWYADDPVYVGNADHILEDVQTWAEAQPGFEEFWFDPDHHRWITLAFSEGDIDALQEQIRAEFPGEGVVAVQVPYSWDELEELQQEVFMGLPDEATGSSWFSAGRGVVEVQLNAPSPEAAAFLNGYLDEPVCADALPASMTVPEEPQPTAGEAWRLLGESWEGEVYRSGVATTAAQYTALWAMAGLDGEPPAVDFETEIALWFAPAESGSCPYRMDDVVVAGALVHTELVTPGPPGACTDDANPHSFVVALERAALPEGPFRVQPEARDPYPGTADERTVVDVDLSAPGSSATDEQIGLDPGLTTPGPGAGAARPGDLVEVGYPFTLAVPIAPGAAEPVCLGELNEVSWVAAAPTDWPPEWKDEAQEGGGELILEALMQEGPSPSLVLEHAGIEMEFAVATGEQSLSCGG